MVNEEIKFVFADTLRPGDHILDSEGQELAIKAIEAAPNGRLEFTVRYAEAGFYADRDYIISKTPKTRIAKLITVEPPDETAALPEQGEKTMKAVTLPLPVAEEISKNPPQSGQAVRLDWQGIAYLFSRTPLPAVLELKGNRITLGEPEHWEGLHLYKLNRPNNRNR